MLTIDADFTSAVSHFVVSVYSDEFDTTFGEGDSATGNGNWAILHMRLDNNSQ